jgi:phosphoribosylglycinamide formyltransferase-1
LKAKIAVISSGRGENLRHILKATITGYIPGSVNVVLADQKDAGALNIAEEYGVRAVYVDPSGRSRSEHEKLLMKEIDKEAADIIVLTGYMRILSPDFVRRYKNRILNIHPALLPSFPGKDAFSQAIDYGVRWTGTTVHIVDEQVDHGPIIYQVPVMVKNGDTKESLKARIQRAEYNAYPKGIKMFLEGRLKLEGRRLVLSKGN